MSFPCECGVNPQPGDGPLEHCPAHGNPQLFARWLQERDDRIEQLEAELERTRQAWVDGDDPMCEEVCVIACKGPCKAPL